MKEAPGGRHHRNGEYSAWLVRKGWARVEAEGAEARAHAGEWLFCFARDLRQEFSKDASLLSVRIRNSWPDNELFFQGPPLLVLPSSRNPELEGLVLQMMKNLRMPKWQTRGGDPQFTFLWKTRVTYEDFLEHQGHFLAWMKAIAVVLRAEGYGLQVPSGVDVRLARVLNALDCTPFHMPFPGTKLADGSGLSIGQLNRMMVKTLGQTAHGYWQSRRVGEAKLLLGQRESTVKSVASSLGFSDLSLFSEWFKREVGEPPREFKKRIMAEANPG